MGLHQVAGNFVFDGFGISREAWNHDFWRVIKYDHQKLVDALGRLGEAPIFIDDTPGISLHEMRAKARRLKASQNGQQFPAKKID